ncbi:hypothetical protein LOD99_12654 [Oopsacas minuta]|uniref:Uncharacterized protein n=1 Tax=Oopsacas minuta TaxID=111878 RepID=A0AAV7JCQ4_9METZ|nr:hypothetical protein LOD99_12654 [Oopsacas minuta]
MLVEFISLFSTQSDWFIPTNVVVQDVYQVITGSEAELEVHFYVSLPDLPKDPDGATDYVVPGEVLFEAVNNSGVIKDILTAVTPISVITVCQNDNELLVYVPAAFIAGVLFCATLLILIFFLYKIYKACERQCSNKKKVFPVEPEKIVLSNLSREPATQQLTEKSLCISSISTLSSDISKEEQVNTSRRPAINAEIQIDQNQNEGTPTFTSEEKEVTTLEDSSIMNPFWETNPRFWSFQERKAGNDEYYVTPLPSEQEQGTTVRDTDSPITEYYSSTDVSVFSSQTSLGKASVKATGKARGRYDLMELASMESLMVQNPTMDKPSISSRPESHNLTSGTTSRSTILYLSSTTPSKSNTSLQELPRCSTAANIDSQEQNKKIFNPKMAWDQD